MLTWVSFTLKQVKDRPMESKITELSAHFRVLGAKNPEEWARSEITEGLPQYTSYAFLREVWLGSVYPVGHTAWIDNLFKSEEKFGSKTEATLIRKMLSLGISREEITLLLRETQISTIDSVLSKIDCSDELMFPESAKPANWAFVEIDEDNQVTRQIECLSDISRTVGEEIEPQLAQFGSYRNA